MNTPLFGKKRTFLLCAGFLCLAPNAFSNTHRPETASPHRYELFISGGVSLPWLNNIAAVAMNGTVTNTYYVQAERRVGGVAGGGIERVFAPKRYLHITLGPTAYYVDFDKIHGVESPISNGGSFDTLNYQFLASGAALLLESRVIVSVSSWQPYFVLGAGNAWNHLSDYDETPSNPAGSAAPAREFFHNHTISSFAYEAGVGISHEFGVDKKRDVTYSYAIDYRYFNFGAGKFRQVSSQTGDQVLGVKTLDASAVVLSLSAAFR